MKQEDWTQQLKDKLADHQVAPPDDLWNAIEARLDEAQPRRRVTPLWHRWAAAAVMALLLAGGALVLWGNRGEDRSERSEAGGERIAEAMKSANVDADVTKGVVEEQPVEEKTTEEKLVALKPKALKPVAQQKEEQEPQTVVTDEQVSESQNTETSVPQEETLPTEKTTAQTMPRPQNAFEIEKTEKKRSDRRPLTATLFAENRVEGQQGIERVQMSHEMYQKFGTRNSVDASRMAEPVWLTDYEEREHHDRPLTLGLQLRYPVTDRLSLNSGIVYTKLKSEFTKVLKGNEIGQQQFLHYVGVPLGLQYRLLTFGPLSLYASAGGQADWNVSARIRINGKDVDIDKDHCQWSVAGSVGLAYHLTSHIGLYVEPNVRHYFDNHSDIQNFFKDKPTNLGLQLGVQVSIGGAER